MLAVETENIYDRQPGGEILNVCLRVYNSNVLQIKKQSQTPKWQVIRQ